MGAWKVLALIFALINYKTIPLSFHFRFYKICLRQLFLSKHKCADLYEQGVYTTFCPLLEMDFNLHKSNSTYFSDMDMSRTVLMSQVFRRFFREYRDPAVKLAKHEWVYTPLGSVSMVFRKEIKAYVKYDVVSQVFGWNDKWLYVVTKFMRNGTVHAFGMAKYVFKVQRKTVPPATAIEFCGLMTAEAKERNERVRRYVDDALELEQIEGLI